MCHAAIRLGRFRSAVRSSSGISKPPIFRKPSGTTPSDAVAKMIAKEAAKYRHIPARYMDHFKVPREVVVPTLDSVEAAIARIQNQDQLNAYIRVLGRSPKGQFGFDTTHRPIETKWVLDHETVPRWIIYPTSPVSEDAEIFLEVALYRQGHTSVYPIHLHSELVIKYYSYCWSPDLDPIDAVVVEAFFMKRLEGLGIAPKFYFYSGFIDTIETDKYLVNPARKIEDISCGPEPSSPRPHIRYMIMERLGMSWMKYMENQEGGKIEFVRAMKIGAKVIMLLRKLHDQNNL